MNFDIQYDSQIYDKEVAVVVYMKTPDGKIYRGSWILKDGFTSEHVKEAMNRVCKNLKKELT
jgi:hypothetical protein